MCGGEGGEREVLMYICMCVCVCVYVWGGSMQVCVWLHVRTCMCEDSVDDVRARYRVGEE